MDSVQLESNASPPDWSNIHLPAHPLYTAHPRNTTQNSVASSAYVNPQTSSAMFYLEGNDLLELGAEYSGQDAGHEYGMCDWSRMGNM